MDLLRQDLALEKGRREAAEKAMLDSEERCSRAEEKLAKESPSRFEQDQISIDAIAARSNIQSLEFENLAAELEKEREKWRVCHQLRVSFGEEVQSGLEERQILRQQLDSVTLELERLKGQMWVAQHEDDGQSTPKQRKIY